MIFERVVPLILPALAPIMLPVAEPLFAFYCSFVPDQPQNALICKFANHTVSQNEEIVRRTNPQTKARGAGPAAGGMSRRRAALLADRDQDGIA